MTARKERNRKKTAYFFKRFLMLTDTQRKVSKPIRIKHKKPQKKYSKNHVEENWKSTRRENHNPVQPTIPTIHPKHTNTHQQHNIKDN